MRWNMFDAGHSVAHMQLIYVYVFGALGQVSSY